MHEGRHHAVGIELKIVGLELLELSQIDIVLDPEEEARWFKPGFPGLIELNPGDGDASISDKATLPALTFIWDATDTLTVKVFLNRRLA